MTETEKLNKILAQLNTKEAGVCHKLNELSNATGLDLITIEVLCKKIDANGDCSYHQHCTCITKKGVYTANNGGYNDDSKISHSHIHTSILQVGGDVNAPILQDSSLSSVLTKSKVTHTPSTNPIITPQTGLRKFISNPLVKWAIGIITALFIAYLIYYLKLNGDRT